MTDFESIKEAPLANLDFFLGDLAKPWYKFTELATATYLQNHLEGSKVLVMAPFVGKIACLLASLKALKITAIELKERKFDESKSVISYFNFDHKIAITDNITDLCADDSNQFDIFYGMTALNRHIDPGKILEKIGSCLKEDSRIVIIEKLHSHVMISWWDRLKQGALFSGKKFHYLKQADLDIIKSKMNTELIMRSYIPALALICGYKK